MFQETYSIGMKQLCEDFKMETIYAPDNWEEILIKNEDLNRPALQLVGFFDYFDNTRIQVIGMVEVTYLQGLSSEDRTWIFNKLFETRIPALIVTRNLEIFPECLECAKNYEIPLFRVPQDTSSFTSSLNSTLKVHLAPRITRHGVLVEVYGEGILLLGDSGVGKSETAIELVKRGHRLIADDAVEIKRVSERTLVGSAPDIIRHFIELRGIGVVDVRRIFGMGSIKQTEKIDLVINLELWQEQKHYDRLGMDTQTTMILDIDVPSLTVPVKPGRNLAVIIEVAAMNHRHKKMGYNAAKELTERLNCRFGIPNTK